MNKTQIIKNTVGEKLKDYGFRYLKTDGPCRIFVREAHGYKRYYDPGTDIVKQYINIQEHRFGKMLTVRFSTDVYGYEIMIHGIEELRKYGRGGWVEYTDEDSYREKLNLFVEIIIRYGLDLLEKMSHEEEIIPTKVMADKLFSQHTALCCAFIDKFNIKGSARRTEDIEEWFQIIKELLIDIREWSYEDAKDMLVMLAAFVGEKMCEICSYRWVFPEHFKTPSVVGGSNFSPLDVAINIWKSKDKDQFEKLLGMYVEMLKEKVQNKQNTDH